MVGDVWCLDLHLPMESLSIFAKVLSTNPAHEGVSDTILCDTACQ